MNKQIIYDRNRLKTFVAHGGFLNLLFGMIPNGLIQDGQIEEICTLVYDKIKDDRGEINLNGVYQDLDLLGKLLDFDATPFKSPQILHIDEYAIHPSRLFEYLYAHSAVSNVTWLAPNSLSFRANLGARTQTCTFNMFANDISISTVILEVSVSQINSNIQEWLSTLQKLLSTVVLHNFCISGGMDMHGSKVRLLLGAHIPGKKINIEDAMFLTKRIILLGDKLESSFFTGQDLH